MRRNDNDRLRRFLDRGDGGDGKIMRHAARVQIELYSDLDGDLSGSFEIKGYFGESEIADVAGIPQDEDPMTLARELMQKFDAANKERHAGKHGGSGGHSGRADDGQDDDDGDMPARAG